MLLEFNAVSILKDEAIEDRVLFSEYEVIYDDLLEVIYNYISIYVRPENKEAIYIYKGEKKEINKKAEQSGKIMDVLLEINVYGEESKQGYSLDELKCDIIELQNLKNLNIIGVMTMAPFTDDEKILRMVFSELRKIKDELNKEYFNNNLTELSMGMSNDYKIALQEGSTFIRVGTKIFK